jgi:ABC-type nitrate/sulfonate/bicarbonate transport system substrate-binding protein
MTHHDNLDMPVQVIDAGSGKRSIKRRSLFRSLAGATAAALLLLSPSIALSQTAESFEPSEGSDIPTVDVRFAMQPFGDTTVGFVAVKSDFFTDVGINVIPKEGQTLLPDQAPGMLLANQLDISIGYVPAMVQNYASQSALKMFQVHNTYIGNYILARPGAGYKSFDEFAASGMNFEDATKATIAQMEGKSVALADQSSPRNLLNLVLKLSGRTPDMFGQLEVLDDTKIVQLGRAGNVDFVLVGGAAQNVQLINAGFFRMFGFGQLAANLPAGDPAVAESFGHVGIVATEDYIANNLETLLRFASVYWRTIDYIAAEPEAALALSLPNLVSASGVEMEVADSVRLFSDFYDLISFDENEQVFNEVEYPLGLDVVYGAQIAAAKAGGIIPQDLAVAPSDIVIAGRLFNILSKLKKDYEELAAANPTADGDLVAAARVQYEYRNYLDAYRLLKAAVNG